MEAADSQSDGVTGRLTLSTQPPHAAQEQTCLSSHKHNLVLHIYSCMHEYMFLTFIR